MSDAELPVNTWVQTAVKLACDSIAARLDREQGDRPYFWYDLASHPPRLAHDYWDFCDMSGRWTDAMVLSRLMLGPRADDTEQRLKAYLLARQGDDGLFYNDAAGSKAFVAIGHVPEGRFADMFCQGRVLLALVTWYLEQASAETEDRIERVLVGLERAFAWEDDTCFAPALRWLADGRWQTDGGREDLACGFAATMAPSIMRYYETSGSRRAMKLAEGLVRGFVLDSQRYAPDGTYAGNTHWAGGLLGPAAAVRLARATGNDELLAFCERIFEHIVSFATDFGWMPSNINEPEPGRYSESCEVCNLTDAFHMALQLIDAGTGDHWDFIDTTVRNQLLEQQFRRPEGLLSDEDMRASDQPIVAALRGNVESWGRPNTLVGNAGGLEGCCTGALVRACYFAWRRAAEEKTGAVWVHLPLSRTCGQFDLLCHEPWHGAVTLRIHRPCNVRFRLSKWIDPDTVRITCNDRPLRRVLAGRYLCLDGLGASDTLRITYPLAETERDYTISGNAYHAVWRGGTVAELTPPGRPYPIYEKRRITDTPTGPPELGCPASPVVW